MAIDEPKAGEANSECIHLHAYETGSEARAGIGWWIYYNFDRPHSTHGGRTPTEVHEEAGDIRLAA